ncbi:MAG: hypothetical protein KGZ59_01715 [Chitinophagaceae bacterium]|nr:hypothetical protein [Chitinophagaceae bacterium]
MHIQIRASEEQKAVLLEKNLNADFKISWYNNEIIEADAYIDLLFELENPAFVEVNEKPIIVHALLKTGNQLPNKYARINAWNGFLEKDKIELATIHQDLKLQLETILKGLGFEVVFVPDIIGLVAPRAISMIINEAYFGLEDEISSKKDIDTAMKLGTNYPFGPFEWAEKIGLSNIANLLIELAKTDTRYTPSTLLLKEAKL